MANVRDAAQYILEKQGEMTTIKLQKLVYYAQAWSLVWRETPLFDARIEAWANGPVAPDLFKLHEGIFRIGPEAAIGDSSRLDEDCKDVIDNVLKGYGEKSGHWLVELARLEEPWKLARGQVPAGHKCDAEISCASMAEYYSGL